MNKDARTEVFDAIILGGGAAGLMCALEAGQRGRKAIVLEAAEKLGKKILISGGGRCNFTNLYCSSQNFISENPHFAKSALSRYTPSDFIALVEKHKIAYHEKTLGQLFCDRSARDIVNMLEAECLAAGVRLQTNVRISEVSRSDEFVVRTSGSEPQEYRARTLVVATGGPSIPKMGATGFAYDLARQFGLKIIPPRPALVPLLFSATDREVYASLAGISADVIASYGSQRFREKMLVTHRGLSGPAILQISSYWRRPHSIHIDLAPDREVTAAVRDSPRRDLSTAREALHGFLSHRLANAWLKQNPPAAYTNSALESWEKLLHNWPVYPAGDEGFDKAEVTAGGIDTEELSAKTMESKKVSGLFFVGEAVDVTGHLGGFNFQWAWASGAVAGRSL